MLGRFKDAYDIPETNDTFDKTASFDSKHVCDRIKIVLSMRVYKIVTFVTLGT